MMKSLRNPEGGLMGKEPRMTQPLEPVQTQEQRVTDFVAAFQSLRAEVQKVIAR